VFTLFTQAMRAGLVYGEGTLRTVTRRAIRPLARDMHHVQALLGFFAGAWPHMRDGLDMARKKTIGTWRRPLLRPPAH
jgi:hypothetical protein